VVSGGSVTCTACFWKQFLHKVFRNIWGENCEHPDMVDPLVTAPALGRAGPWKGRHVRGFQEGEVVL
jgi:hypothetical protein